MAVRSRPEKWGSFDPARNPYPYGVPRTPYTVDWRLGTLQGVKLVFQAYLTRTAPRLVQLQPSVPVLLAYSPPDSP